MANKAFQLGQVEASTNQLADQQMPVYNLASKILCWVINVSLKIWKPATTVFRMVMSHSAILPVKMGKVCMAVTLPTGFLWLELQSTSFVADQKLPYLDFAGRRFRIGRLEDKKVIIVMTGLSMLNAGISTQLLQTLFKVKGVVHYGIAGNADPQLEIGDVTIPQFWAHTGLWNWQSNRCQAKSENGNEESIPKSRICSEWS